MNKILVASTISMVPCMVFAAGAFEGIGVGAIVGEPTGISVKKWLSPTRAVDFAAAWSFSENDSLELHGDYLFHDFTLLKPQGIKGRMPVYTGLGVRVKLRDSGNSGGRNAHDNLIGVRVPIGISYLFGDAPVDLFGELVPILDLAPDSRFDINLAFGARLYF
jgi:hypothetical protein